MKFPAQNLSSKVCFWKGKGVINEGFQKDGNKTANGQPAGAAPQVESAQLEEGQDQSQGTGRQQWNSPIEFLLSCIAMSVGLGNIWRFPVVAYNNGGGAFLIPYFLVLLFIGKPLYYMELCLGQFSSYGPVKVWNLAPAFRGVGYGQMFATWCVVTYYVVLMALTVYYFFASFSTQLPWETCKEGVENCYGSSINLTGLNVSALTSSSEHYFTNEVLKKAADGLDSGLGAPDWKLTLCLLLSWIILLVVLYKGVQSSGKAAYFTALFPYLVLFTLLIRSCMLEGAGEGVKFFFTPDWKKLADLNVWYSALTQSFFSLSIGFGSITMFSSFNGFRQNVYRDALIVSITDTLTSCLAGCTVFAILGHLSFLSQGKIQDVIKGGGTSLAFITYPDVLARFGVLPQFFAVIFFLMLFTLGVGSASALTGSVITIICDDFPNLKRSVVTAVTCALGFLLGLFYVTPQGQYILDLVDYYGGSFIIFILAFFEIAAVNWVYGTNNLVRDIEFMLKRKTGWYWKFCWFVLIPIVMVVIFIYKLVTDEPLASGGYVFNSGAVAAGIIITIVAVMMVPVLFGVEIFKNYKEEGSSLWSSVKSTFKPNAEWGPRDPVIRKEYFDFLQQQKENKDNEDNPKRDAQGVDNMAANFGGEELSMSSVSKRKFV